MAGPYFEKRGGERSKKSVDREIRWKKTTWQATAAIRDELVQELSRVEGYIEKLLTKEDGGNLFKRHCQTPNNQSSDYLHYVCCYVV